jgi:hypothetical protein
MREKREDIHLWRHWPLWGLHFGLHLLVGIIGMGAGIVVVVQGQILSGLALCGAALFAVLNGWAGYKALWKSKKNRVNAT